MNPGFHSDLAPDAKRIQPCCADKRRFNIDVLYGEQGENQLITVIKEHIRKTKKRPEYRISYVVLISKLIEYFKVDVENEVVEVVKAQHEISAATLNKIGLKKVDDDY